MKGNVLIVPPEGLMHLFHTEKDFDPDYYTTVLIVNHEGRGDFAMVDARINNHDFKVGMFINCPVEQKVNSRAREVIAEFFGWHMVFVGPIFIAGLTDSQARSILETVT